MKNLSLPQLHQTYEYDCGAKALQTVLVYYGIDVLEGTLMKQAKTSSTSGTSITDIARVASLYGFKTDLKEMSIEDIKKYLKKKVPVILLLQAWTEKDNIDWRNDWEDGHYVVAIGYTKEKVLFEDPYSFERTYLTYDELEKRWHDGKKNGKKYSHRGLVIYGKKPHYDSKKTVHMD